MPLPCISYVYSTEEQVGINLDRHHVGLHWCVRTNSVNCMTWGSAAFGDKKRHEKRFAANGPQYHTLPANAVSEL